MIRNLTSLLVTSLALLSLSCLESTNPGTPDLLAYQVPGCGGGVGKVSADSCFSYRFRRALAVDFCASGNCCPDSNRFLIEAEVAHDTIFVTIADTAGQLCRCNCSYLLHVELYDLPLSSYVFVCRREDYSSRYILYCERIYREAEIVAH
jgi:hypothetical protein